jgi:hypothetical protein
MERSKVFEAIDDERYYQDRKWGTIEEHPHEVGAWIMLMTALIRDAEVAWSSNAGDQRALEEIRKVLAVGVACAEQHGIPGRSRFQPVDKQMRLC